MKVEPMNRRRFLTSITLLPLAAVPALAAGKKIAVLPAAVTVGRGENGNVVTEALRARLSRIGFEVVSAQRVASAMRSRRMDLTQPQAVQDLAALREELGVDFVVYPRVLNVGKSLAGNEFQANILVNIAGKSRSGFAHTRQVGQVFNPRGARPESAVIGKSEADQAATKLLSGFESRAK